MININPSYSFILTPDEEFLNKFEIKKIMGKLRDLKNQILRNQNTANDDSFISPFMKEEETDNENDNEEEYEYMDMMDMNIWEKYRKLKLLKENNKTRYFPKKGVSLMSKKEKQIIKGNTKQMERQRSPSFDELNLNKNSSIINNNIQIMPKYNNKYSKLIKKIFCKKLNDFRSEIIIYCLKNYFFPDNFENFVCFLEFFILIYTGVRTKY